MQKQHLEKLELSVSGIDYTVFVYEFAYGREYHFNGPLMERFIISQQSGKGSKPWRSYPPLPEERLEEFAAALEKNNLTR